jgi:F-type H+-transporting ATPase subunit b
VALVAAALLIARPCAAQTLPEEAAKAAEQGPAEIDKMEHGTDGGPNPMAVDPDLAIWTVVVFVLLFLILSIFAWPQISAALEEREKKIADHMAAAAKAQEDAKLLLAQHEAKLAAAAGEVRALLEEARRDAETTKGRIVAEARQAGEEEKQRALREIDRAKDGAIQQLATASANVAIELARKVIQQKITPDEHTAVVREALNKLATEPSKN